MIRDHGSGIAEDSGLNTIRKEIETLQISIEKREINLKNSAITDGLTGVYNRKGLELCLTTAMRKYELFDNYDFSIIIVDIDNFKKINDTYGLKIGDRLRKTIEKMEFIHTSDKEEIIKITVSGGVAQYEAGLDIEQFIKKADVLLYRAKNSGKNKICVK